MATRDDNFKDYYNNYFARTYSNYYTFYYSGVFADGFADDFFMSVMTGNEDEGVSTHQERVLGKKTKKWAVGAGKQSKWPGNDQYGSGNTVGELLETQQGRGTVAEGEASQPVQAAEAGAQRQRHGQGHGSQGQIPTIRNEKGDDDAEATPNALGGPTGLPASYGDFTTASALPTKQWTSQRTIGTHPLGGPSAIAGVVRHPNWNVYRAPAIEQDHAVDHTVRMTPSRNDHGESRGRGVSEGDGRYGGGLYGQYYEHLGLASHSGGARGASSASGVDTFVQRRARQWVGNRQGSVSNEQSASSLPARKGSRPNMHGNVGQSRDTGRANTAEGEVDMLLSP